MEGVYFVWGGSYDRLGKELDSSLGEIEHSQIAQIGYCFIVIFVSLFSFS